MSTHEIYSDKTVRTVMARVGTPGPIPAHRGSSGRNPWIHYFTPVEAVLTFHGSRLVKAILRGPKSKKNGEPHATQWTSWNWPMLEHHGPDVGTVWEAEPPECLVGLLEELEVPR